MIFFVIARERLKRTGSFSVQTKEIIDMFRLIYLIETKFLDLYYSS